MHKKNIFLSSLILTVFLFLSFSVYASYESSTMGLYTFQSTLVSMQLYNNDTGSWVDILAEGGGPSSGEYIVNIASGDAGTQIGSYATGQSVTAGTYSKIRVRIKCYCKIKGWMQDGSSGTYYVTDADSYLTDPDTGIQYFIATSEFTGSGAPTEADCEEVTLTPPPGQAVDEYFTQTIDFSSTVTLNAGDSADLAIVFDLSSQLELRTETGPGNQTIHMILPPEQGGDTGTPEIYLNSVKIN